MADLPWFRTRGRHSNFIGILSLSQKTFSTQNGKYSLLPLPEARIGHGHERFADGYGLVRILIIHSYPFHPGTKDSDHGETPRARKPFQKNRPACPATCAGSQRNGQTVGKCWPLGVVRPKQAGGVSQQPPRQLEKQATPYAPLFHPPLPAYPDFHDGMQLH
jgi:hypothetical protein